MAEKPETLTTTQARGGVGTHVMRYVLVISTVLAIAALAWVYLAGPTVTGEEPARSDAAAPLPDGQARITPPLPVPR